MKHILNNLSQEEKNSILEQHKGGMKVMTENFSKLLNSKLGDVKPMVNEQVLPNLSSGKSNEAVRAIFAKCGQVPKELGPVAKNAANVIYQAIQGMGTNEQAIVNAFAGLKTLNQFCSAADAYKQTYGVDMYQDLDGDIDEEPLWAGISRILVNLRPDPSVAKRVSNAAIAAKTAKATQPGPGATKPTSGVRPTTTPKPVRPQ